MTYIDKTLTHRFMQFKQYKTPCKWLKACHLQGKSKAKRKGVYINVVYGNK